MENNDWHTPEDQQAQIHQAQDLKAQAARNGLTFEAFLPPSLAVQLLNAIADGAFRDPSEFVFVAAKTFFAVENHPDLKRELLKQQVQAGLNSGPGLSTEALLAELNATAGMWKTEEPAVWVKTAKQST